MMGYESKIINSVKVEVGKTAKIDFFLNPRVISFAEMRAKDKTPLPDSEKLMKSGKISGKIIDKSRPGRPAPVPMSVIELYSFKYVKPIRQSKI